MAAFWNLFKKDEEWLQRYKGRESTFKKSENLADRKNWDPWVNLQRRVPNSFSYHPRLWSSDTWVLSRDTFS